MPMQVAEGIGGRLRFVGSLAGVVVVVVGVPGDLYLGLGDELGGGRMGKEGD